MRRFLLTAAAILVLAGPAMAAPGDKALEDVRILSADDMEGRLAGSPAAHNAMLYVAGRLHKMGLEPVLHPFHFTGRDGREIHAFNLMAPIEGTEPGGKVIVVMAHYDHLGEKDGVIFNGADDNASGIAGLLAVAEAFKTKRPKHTVYIVALDGEEMGLKGATAFVKVPLVPLETIGLVVNFDMISKSDKGELHAAGGTNFPWLRARLERLATTAPVTLRLGHDTNADGEQNNWTYQSDHGVFARAGVPWVYFGVEDHPEYHKPTDDFATVPPDFFLRSVKTVVAACRLFDEDLDAMMNEAGR